MTIELNFETMIVCLFVCLWIFSCRRVRARQANTHTPTRSRPQATARQWRSMHNIAHVRHDSFIRVHDLLICDVTHSYGTWLIPTRDMTHSCVTWLMCMWHDSFVCDMTRSWQGNDAGCTWMSHESDDAQCPRMSQTTHDAHDHTWMSHDSLIIVTRLNYNYDMTHL